MLSLLNLAQLVLYIALLALLGQGALSLIAGPGRGRNPFYRLLQVVSRPFTKPVRLLTPQKVSDGGVSVVTFCLLAVVYGVVTFEKIDLCVRAGMAGCR